MPPPPQIAQWLRRTYPKPQVDPEWLDGCWTWIEKEHRLDPATQMDEIIQQVDAQLLQSDLSDSMLSGTGLPGNISEISTTFAGPILVEIVALTDIGVSAFSLQTTRQARLEYDNSAQDEEEDAGKPSYPRATLRFELSDGTTIIKGWEYGMLPEIVLGETPLGYKLLLKDVLIRKGLAYLEPKCVVTKGGSNPDRNELREADFARSLRIRLGQPEDPAEHQPDAPAPAVPAALMPPPPPPAAAPRSPLRELSPPVAGPSHTAHEDDADQPRRRKLPVRNRSPSIAPPPRPSASSSISTTSSYFATVKDEPPAALLARARLFSPHRTVPVVIDSDEEDPPPPPPRAVPLARDDSWAYYVGENDESFELEAAAAAQRAEADLAAHMEPASSALGASSGSGTGSSALVPAPAPRILENLGVIMIEDSDEDDKENVPVQTRHVRRRTVSQDEDVIELSD